MIVYLNVSSNRTPLLTFDPNIPTHIIFPTLQGKSMYSIWTWSIFALTRYERCKKCILKLWHTDSLTDWLTEEACSHKVFPNGWPNHKKSQKMSIWSLLVNITIIINWWLQTYQKPVFMSTLYFIHFSFASKFISWLGLFFTENFTFNNPLWKVSRPRAFTCIMNNIAHKKITASKLARSPWQGSSTNLRWKARRWHLNNSNIIVHVHVTPIK